MIVNQLRLKIVKVVVRIARVDGWTVGQKRMSKSWAAIVPQRAKPGIGIQQITSANQVTGTVVAAEIVAI